jgi:hypothetical protein
MAEKLDKKAATKTAGKLDKSASKTSGKSDNKGSNSKITKAVTTTDKLDKAEIKKVIIIQLLYF